MGLAVYTGFFETRADVMEDMKQTGHWPATYVSDESGELPLHWHDGDISGYVIEGSTYLLDSDGNRFDIKAGDKFEISAGTVHAEGEVKSRTVYIIGTAGPGSLREKLALHNPAEPFPG